MSGASAFGAHYKRLNKEQKEAVDAIEGPVMVIAGPGTGKTQILTLRIANILRKTDVPPDAILALTFTEAGAYSMRSRLVSIIGSAAYRVHIHTFHGFCNDVIESHPESFPAIIGAAHINDVDKIRVLETLLETGLYKAIKPFGDPTYYIAPLRRIIADLKRENVTPKRLADIVARQEQEFDAIEDLYYEDERRKGKMRSKYAQRANTVARNRELADIYRRYQEHLREHRLYDYEDMIVETVRALEEDENLLLELEEEYQYLLADEHQDANNAQNRLLELLSSFHESPNLFIVGDEKQAIFRFQGASLDNFLYFTRRFPEAKVIRLTANYRSQQGILDAAHSLISKGADEEGLRVPLESKRDGAVAPITVRSFSNPALERLFLLADIEQKIAEGVEPSEMAILFRTNRDADALVHALEKTDIPFVVESDQNALADPDVRKVLHILKALAHFGDDTFLPAIIHYEHWGIDGHDAYRAIAHVGRRGDLYHLLKSKERLIEAGIESPDALHELYQKLHSWQRAGANKGVLEMLEIVVRESGLLDELVGHERSDEKLERINGLFADIERLLEAHRDVTLADVVEYLSLLEEYNIPVKKEGKRVSREGVRLMTVHKSKGLEFDYVFVVGATEGHFGGRRNRTLFDVPIGEDVGERDAIDDERRLFYVALTRARLGAAISYARESEDGKPRLPSRFIEEIDEKLRHEEDTSAFEEKADTSLLLSPPRREAPSGYDKRFLNELFRSQGLSVTALNNYLECPWRYFYSSLLRIPQAPNKSAMFGNAVHSALKDFFDQWRLDEDPGAAYLVERFSYHASREPFASHELDEALEKGKAALEGYYERWHESWPRDIRNELAVSVLLPFSQPIGDEASVGELTLRGTLDKLEFLDGGRVNIVDYKSGKPDSKSRNWILGKTQARDSGNYFRQLVFYRLLLELYDEGRWKMESGEIDFIEPAKNGTYRKERFDVSNDEVQALRELIHDTAAEILNLSFWERRCGEKHCHFCALRNSATSAH